MANFLQSDIKYLAGIGPKRGELLTKELGISTFKDLLYFFPFRYIDRSRIYLIKELLPTMAYVQIRGKITSITMAGNTPSNKRLVATMKDSSGTIELVFFKGIKWIKEKIAIGTEYIAFGKPSEFNGIINMVHPELNLPSTDIIFGGSSMMGVYSSTEKLKNNNIGNKVFAKLEHTLIEKYLSGVEETLPQYILDRKGLSPLQYALKNIHFPESSNALLRAQTRLK